MIADSDVDKDIDKDDDQEAFSVPPTQEGQRLDLILARQSGLPRARVQKIIAAGQCFVDGRVVLLGKTKLAAGQTVAFNDLSNPGGLSPEEGDLRVLYEDDCLAVVAKPSGLTVHPCSSCPENTLVGRLLARFPQLAAMDGERPGIVHRLDKDTSGLLLVALTEDCRLALSEDFAERLVEKHYLALTRGAPPANGRSELPLGRHPTHKTKMAVVREKDGGRAALTTWTRLYADPEQRFALLDVRLHTGRTHQIRVHLAQAGHPLWGDKLYGPGGDDPANRQMLHAWKLSFDHPVSGERLDFCLPPPEDFQQTAIKLAHRLLPVILTGSPGSGKSLAAQKLAERGLPVWNADQAVDFLYQPGQDGWQLLDRFFHGLFIQGQEPVDKKKLQQAMTEDDNLRREVENLIHPLVFGQMRAFLEAEEKKGHDLAVAEVPLWFESGMHVPEAVVVCVDADLETRCGRLRARGWDEARIAATESWQWPADKKAARADLVLDNTGGLGQFEAELERLLENLRRLARQRDQDFGAELELLWSAQRESE